MANPLTAPVHVTVFQKMPELVSKIIPKYVYIIVRENHNRYKDILLKHLRIKSCEEEKFDNSCNLESINTSEPLFIALYSKTFDLIVSSDKMANDETYTKTYIIIGFIGYCDRYYSRKDMATKTGLCSEI